jgi:hypothetical protein
MPKCPNPSCSGWVHPFDLVPIPKNKKYPELITKCDTCKYEEHRPFLGNKIDDKVNVPFGSLYRATPYEVYKSDIENFFNDKILDPFQYWERPDGLRIAKGFIWVASHGHFETLTVEPMDGNQFEIAVRFKDRSSRVDNGPVLMHKYSGYSISPVPFRFLGFDTGGH